MVRIKNRYFVVQVEPHAFTFDTTSRILYQAILGRVESLHGDYGLASIKDGFEVSYCNDKTGIALVRARHGPHKIVMSTVPLVTKVGDKKASLRTLYTGATLLKCKQFIMKYQKQQLVNALKDARNQQQRQCLEETYLKISFVEKKDFA
ncbi:ribonuclease P/MRP protein subunit POP5-like [Artemia franciscana]|uniref:ribonuclease P/MRP protein subunit POP5-like n=1 Tax=Artemia franciscana TaxID=6661 RepID=UPI0032DB889C